MSHRNISQLPRRGSFRLPLRGSLRLPHWGSLRSQKILRNAALLASLLVGSAAVSAIEAGGVRFADRVTLAGGELVANGAGVRSRFVFDVYAMALYLPARATTAEAVAAQTGARRIALQLLRDVSAEDFVGALKAGLQANLGPAELSSLQPQIDQFGETLLAVKQVKKGTPVTIDYLPASGTRITIAGQVRGADIAGRDFFDALLKVWLGGQPVQADLKTRLLGR